MSNNILDTEKFLSPSKKSIDTIKVIVEIWKNHKDPSFVEKLMDILVKSVDEKKVFEDIEFYLPQIAHIIIHLDIEAESNPLQKFVIIISQLSMHCALQLSFILIAAMEDYQPTNSKGMINPSANETLYKRCAKLLQCVESAVVFGNASNEDTFDYQKAIDFSSNLLNKNNSNQNSNNISGVLYFKRIERKGMFYSKPWKPRYFEISQRILYMYRNETTRTLLIAFPLHSCKINTPANAKYEFYFELENEATNTKLLVRALDKDTMNKWIKAFNAQLNDVPQIDSNLLSGKNENINTSFVSNSNDSNAVVSAQDINLQSSKDSMKHCIDMNDLQQKKFQFFKQERDFVTILTNICESLRTVDKEERKKHLMNDLENLVIPPFTYLPLCKSSDQFTFVLNNLPKFCHAFTTKARVPALILFEIQRHPIKRVDYVSFLSKSIWEYTLDELKETRPIISGYSSLNNSISRDAKSKHLALHTITKRYVSWKEEGTGMQRASGKMISLDTSSISDSTTTENLTVDFNNSSEDMKISSKAIFVDSEPFSEKKKVIASKSVYKDLPGWDVGGLIAKSNDDVRQEVFVMQLISLLKHIFETSKVPVWLYTYCILSTSKTTGLIELIPDAISLDGLKKKNGYPKTLRKYFEVTYGSEDSPEFIEAMNNFVQSLAGYSVVSYLLAIKDRHNGNIMIDSYGHLIHIDFGFVFGLAPGKAFSMETAPFKLNAEFIEVLGGKNSIYFEQFTNLCTDALLAAKKNAPAILAVMEIMFFKSNYPAFKYNSNALNDMKERLHVKSAEKDIPKIVQKLISTSFKHRGADYYDIFQYHTNGIAI